MHARVLRGAVTLTLAVVLAAATPVVAQTPDAQATDAGRLDYDNGLPDAARSPRRQDYLDVLRTQPDLHEVLLQRVKRSGTYTFVGGAADVVTVTPRTGTSGTGESESDEALFAITSGAKSGQATLTLRYDGPRSSPAFEN